MRLAQRLKIIWDANRWLPSLTLFLFLGCLGLYLFSSYVTLPELQRTESRFLLLQSEVRAARQVAATSGDPISQAERGRKDLLAFESLIPDRAGFDLLIGELFTLAEEAGLQIDSVTYRPDTLAEQKLLKYGFDFSVSGDYQQLKQFLFLLEGSERLIIVNRLSLAQAGGREGVSLNLSLATFFRLQGA